MRLHVGCGPVAPENWVNIDADPRWGAMVADPLEGLPWPDETYEAAYCAHVLQAVPYVSLVPFLVEIRRVLVDGGILRLVVPDLIAGIGHYLEGNVAAFKIDPAMETTTDGALCAWLSQAGATRSVFTPSWVRTLLLRAGFEHTERCEFGRSITPGLADMDDRADESVFVEAW